MLSRVLPVSTLNDYIQQVLAAKTLEPRANPLPWTREFIYKK